VLCRRWEVCAVVNFSVDSWRRFRWLVVSGDMMAAVSSLFMVVVT
jgi:hypothetical protein